MATHGRSVKGLTALITGAGNGMGRATAELFAADGANVIVTDRDADAALRVANGICAAGGTAMAACLDVTVPQAIRPVVDAAVSRFGGIDALVNNAGDGGYVKIDDAGYDEFWAKMIALHMTAAQQMTREVLPYLRRSAAGRIVNIASTEALGTARYDTAYSAAKGGVVSLTRALAVELGPDGITVNCICPGPIETALTALFSAEEKAKFVRRRTAPGRYGQPEDVAHITLSLCTPGASYVTGAIIPVDGGLSARLI